MANLLKRKRLRIIVISIVIIVASGIIVGSVFYPAGRLGKIGFEPPIMPPPQPMPVPEPAEITPGEEGAEPFLPSSIEVVDRKIIYNAWISMEVQDVDVAVSQIQTITDEFNGYVSQMSVSKKEDVKTGSVTVRVPQADFYVAIEQIELIGEVKDKNIGSEDVTEQYIDLKARLENAQRQEQRLLEILEKAYDVEDMLNIERELNRIREQIEIYTGQLTYLESRVEYASITVTLTEPSPPEPFPDVDWDAAFKKGLWGLFIIVQGLIVLAFALIPPVAVGVPIYYIYRRRKKKAVS